MMFAALIVALAPVAFCAAPLCGVKSSVTKNIFTFNNNEYNKADAKGANTQCLTVDSASSSACAWHAHWHLTQVASAQMAPIGYPYSSIEAQQGKLVSDIGSMETKAVWRYTKQDDIVSDVSYDLFTSANPDNDPSYGDYELMIWLASYGGKIPISDTGSPIASTTIGGINWQVYLGSQIVPTSGTNQTTYSFVAPTKQTSWSGDVAQFFDYLSSSQGFPSTSQYLLTFQFGTETFKGGPATFHVDHWDASIN